MEPNKYGPNIDAVRDLNTITNPYPTHFNLFIYVSDFVFITMLITLFLSQSATVQVVHIR